MTVYYQFGSLRGLLEGLCDSLAMAGGMDRLASVFRQPDALEALDEFIAVFMRFWESDREVRRWLGAFAGLQALRLWIIHSLGPFWTTRVITLPGAPLVRRGPYRFLRHPNYVVVVAEIAVLPLVFGAWRIAAVFSVLNLALLAWRIRIEQRALAPRALC